jgi:hypothetical protein
MNRSAGRPVGPPAWGHESHGHRGPEARLASHSSGGDTEAKIDRLIRELEGLRAEIRRK